MNKKRRIYLSAPISGYDLEERKDTFMKKQVELTGMGHEVLNPMENGLPDDSPVQQHMKRDIEMLLTCDTIYMMEGWNRSAGCKVELDVAVAIGLDVVFEKVETVEL